MCAVPLNNASLARAVEVKATFSRRCKACSAAFDCAVVPVRARCSAGVCVAEGG
ncbi:MAG: hypothetical protein ACOZQL_40905 [Myxococcota bacterium]